MKKSVLTIACALVSVFGLAACGTTSVSSASSVYSVNVADYTSFSVTNKEALAAEWHVGDADRQLQFTGNIPVNAVQLIADGSLTVASSNTEAVAVNGTYISAVGVGDATITATLNGLTDSFAVTTMASKKAPDLKYSTIADVFAATEEVGSQAYVTTAKVLSFKTGTDGGTYGNFNVDIDGAGTAGIVYGATAKASALAFDTATMKYKFSNPKDFMTNTDTKAIKVGDSLDMLVIRADYKTTKEINAVILGINGAAISSATLTSDEVQAETNYLSLVSYTVTGKITAWKKGATDGTKYGNFYIKTDGAKSADLYVYGATATAGKLGYSSTKSKTVLTNPKDFLTNEKTKALAIGSSVTLLVTRCDYNGTIEVTGIVL